MFTAWQTKTQFILSIKELLVVSVSSFAFSFHLFIWNPWCPFLQETVGRPRRSPDIFRKLLKSYFLVLGISYFLLIPSAATVNDPTNQTFRFESSVFNKKSKKNTRNRDYWKWTLPINASSQWLEESFITKSLRDGIFSKCLEQFKHLSFAFKFNNSHQQKRF